MNRLGKVTIGLVLAMMLAIGVTWMATYEAKAATIASQTFVLPSSSSVTHSADSYIVIWDRNTGNMVDAGSGVVSASTIWADAAIDENHGFSVHTQNATVYTATIPALSDAYRYALAVYDNATPTKGDAPTAGPFLYDPRFNVVFSDTNPVRSNMIHVVQ